MRINIFAIRHKFLELTEIDPVFKIHNKTKPWEKSINYYYS